MEYLESCETMAVFIIFPKSRNTFQYPLSKRVCKRLSKRLFSSCYVYHRNSIESTSREEGLVTAQQLHCAVWPVEQRSCRAHAYISRSVGDIKKFQNNFAFIISTETCFWLKRISDHTFFRRFKKVFLTHYSKQLCVYHLQKSPWKLFGNLNSTPEKLW